MSKNEYWSFIAFLLACALGFCLYVNPQFRAWFFSFFIKSCLGLSLCGFAWAYYEGSHWVNVKIRLMESWLSRVNNFIEDGYEKLDSHDKKFSFLKHDIQQLSSELRGLRNRIKKLEPVPEEAKKALKDISNLFTGKED